MAKFVAEFVRIRKRRRRPASQKSHDFGYIQFYDMNGVPMECIRKSWFLFTLAALVGAPAAAHAQYPFRTFGGGYFGNYGGYGFGNVGGYGFGSLGGFGYGNVGAFGYGNYGNVGGYGYGNYGNVGGYGGYGLNPGLISPYGPNAYGRSAPVMYPGFSASEPARARPTVYPAIPEPAQGIIAAALQGNDNDKALIELHLPAPNAKVYLDGVLTRQTGPDRMFITPKLTAGKRYAFNVEIVWQDESGMRRSLTRQVRVRAGETSTLYRRARPIRTAGQF